MPRPKTDFIAFQLRMPPAMHHELAELADKAGLSLNAEILRRLLATLDRRISDYITRTEAQDAEERRARDYIASIRDPALQARMRAEMTAWAATNKDVGLGEATASPAIAEPLPSPSK